MVAGIASKIVRVGANDSVESACYEFVVRLMLLAVRSDIPMRLEASIYGMMDNITTRVRNVCSKWVS